MSDNLKFISFEEKLPEDGQKIVYTIGGMPGCTMCTFRFDLLRRDVFNYSAILRLDSGAYMIQLSPKDIDKFKWCAVNE